MQKLRVVNILIESFVNNDSINFVIGNSKNKEKRFTRLLEYSYDKAILHGGIVLSQDNLSCCIYLDSTKSKTSFKSIYLDLKLVFGVIGLGRLKNVLKREAIIKKCFPKTDFIHIWYVGVVPDNQGQGLGTNLLNQIIKNNKNKVIYLETSNQRNIPFYNRLGFIQKDDLSELGYPLKTFVYNG